MHREDIKAAIRKKGSSISAIARDLGVTQMAVGLVVADRQRSKRVAKAVSKVTGLLVSDMWPGKYPDIEFLERLAQAKPAAVKAALHAAVATPTTSTKRSPAKRRAA